MYIINNAIKTHVLSEFENVAIMFLCFIIGLDRYVLDLWPLLIFLYLLFRHYELFLL